MQHRKHWGGGRVRQGLVTAAALAVSATGIFAVTSFNQPAGAAHSRRALAPAARRTCTVGPEATPTCGAYWGAHSVRGWKSFEGLIGRKLAIVQDYSRWDKLFPTRSEKAAADQGSLLFVDWSLGGTQLTWAQIAAGDEDAQVRSEATTLKAFRHPIMIAFQSEMDRRKYASDGTPRQFVLAWRHIHRLFRQAGVKNVIWVWDITGDVTHSSELPKLYPGDAYVNWIMWDAYNWYGCTGGARRWRAFGEVVWPMYNWLTRNSGKAGNGHYLSKPWGLGEYGTVEGPNTDSKAQWFSNLIPELKTYPRLKALIYLDFNDSSAGRTCRWSVDSSKDALAGFRAAGHSRYVSVMPSAVESSKTTCPSCGRNLLLNPGAEASLGSADGAVVKVPGWKGSGGFTAVPYRRQDGALSEVSPGPKRRGKNYFYGGVNVGWSTGTQIVKLSGRAISSGKIGYALDGWLGGFAGQSDDATVLMTFLNVNGSPVGRVVLGPVTAKQRKDLSGLLYCKRSGLVPAATAEIKVQLRMKRYAGRNDDGVADSLSLTLSQS